MLILSFPIIALFIALTLLYAQQTLYSLILTMGNQQKITHKDNKFLSSSFTLKEHSNMPVNQAKNQKKSRFLSHPLQNAQPQNLLKTKLPKQNPNIDHLTVNYVQKQQKYKYTDSYEVKDNEKSSIQNSGKEIKKQEDESLRMTHINAKTKKSQMKQNVPSMKILFPRNSKAPFESRINQGAQHNDHSNVSLLEKSQLRRGQRIKLNQQQELRQRQAGLKIPDRKMQSNHSGSILRIPSGIEDMDTIRLSQSIPRQLIRNTVVTSENSMNQINTQEFLERGYFLPTDTHKGDKVVENMQKPNVVQKQKKLQRNKVYLRNDCKQQEDQGCAVCECNLSDLPLLNRLKLGGRKGQRQKIFKQNRQTYELPDLGLLSKKRKNENQDLSLQTKDIKRIL